MGRQPTCRCSTRARPAGRRGPARPAHPRRHPGAGGASSTTRTASASTHGWLGRWLLRAEELARDRDPALRATAQPTSSGPPAGALERLRDPVAPRRRRPSCGRCCDAGAVELLGGPATHPFLPLLPAAGRAFALGAGLDDAALRLGRRPAGIWAAGVRLRPRHGAGATRRRACATSSSTSRALHGGTAHRPAVSGASGRRRVRPRPRRSPTGCGPRARASRGGARLPRLPRPRPPLRAAALAGHRPPARRTRSSPTTRSGPRRRSRRDAADFVAVVRDRLSRSREQHGRPALAVVGFDTELFGHWWHEGPAWLEAVLRTLPEAGVRVATLRGAVDGAGSSATRSTLPAGIVGRGQGPAAVGRPERWPTWPPTGDDVQRTGSLDVVRSARAARPATRRADRTPWPGRRCWCCPATGRSWCRGTARPATPGSGTTGTSRGSTRWPTPSRAPGRTPGRRWTGRSRPHLDARSLVAAHSRA